MYHITCQSETVWLRAQLLSSAYYAIHSPVIVFCEASFVKLLFYGGYDKAYVQVHFIVCPPFFSSPGQSPGTAIVLPPALVLALAKC